MLRRTVDTTCMHRRWWIAGCVLLACASWVAASAMGANGNVVVTMDVPSATTLTNNCTATSATSFGTIQPGTSATTATGAGACMVGFSSSNDSAGLRIGSSDGQGFAMSSPTAAWTVSRTNGSHLRTVRRSSTNVALAGGFGGWVTRTTDGGTTWGGSQALASGDYVFEVDNAPGSDNVWVIAGGGGQLVSTTNALTSAPASPTWTSHSGALQAAGWPAATHVEGVAVVSATTWLVAGGNRIGRTTDAGVSWTTYTVAGVSQLLDIAALDANTIYATGSNAALLKTTTGGNNAAAWSTSTHPWCSCWFQRLSVADASHVYLSSDGGIIARWDGTSFVTSTTVDEKVFRPYSVSSPPSAPTVVYVATQRGKILRSTDSGATFTRLDTEGYGALMDVHALDGTKAMAVGSVDLILRTTDGTSWPAVAEHATRRSLENGDWHPTDGQRVIVVGGDGTILRSTDSGGTWSTIASGTTANLNAVTWITGTRVIAVGSGGTVLTSADGGTTWTARTSGSGAELLDVAHGSDGRAWAVGTGGTILFSTNYGQSWTAQASGTAQPLASVGAGGTTMAVAGGDEGTLLRTNDSGATWTPVAGVPAWDAVTGVSGTNATDMWVGTRFSGLLRSTDAGATFTLVASYPGNPIDSLDAVSSTIAAIDQWGVTSISRDAGATWTTQFAYSGVDFNFVSGIAITDPHTMVAVDDLGGVVQQDEASAAGAQIPDYAGGANFGSGATTGTFGVCLQSLASASTFGTWVADGGTCTTSDADPWKPLPTAPATVATAATGVTGTATFVWGLAPKATQAPGTYRAGVVFETVAPAA